MIHIERVTLTFVNARTRRTRMLRLSFLVDVLATPKRRMKLAGLTAAVLAMALASPLVVAQTAAAGSTAPGPSAVDTASIQALKDMGAFLQTLKRFRTSNSLTGERVLADGQKLLRTAAATVDVQRPDRLRAHMWSMRSEREIIYDGKTVTVLSLRRSTTRRSSSLARMANSSRSSKNAKGSKFRCPTCSSGALRLHRSTRSNRP